MSNCAVHGLGCACSPRPMPMWGPEIEASNETRGKVLPAAPTAPSLAGAKPAGEGLG